MILEQRLQEVSNRNSPGVNIEIKDAIKSISDSYQEEPSEKATESLDNHLQDELTHLKEEFPFLEDQNTANIDYESLFSYLENKTKQIEELYQQETEHLEQGPSIMSDEEAEKTVQKIQLSYLTGNKDDLSYEEKENFHKWQQLNKTLLMLYHQLSPIRSDDVDYSKLN